MRSAVSDLFTKGSSFMVFPYRVIYRVLPEEDPQVARVAIMTIAPKKRFKHAVDRNHVKRLGREAYRLNKLPLIAQCEAQHKKLAFALLYCDNKFITYEETEQRMHRILKTLNQKVAE